VSEQPASAAPRRRFRHPVGPKLRRLLYVVFALVALIGVNTAFLLAVSLLEWRTGRSYENWFYLTMFLLHLVLGLLLVVPVIAFGALHIRNTHNRPNRRAVRVGYALFTTAIVVLVSGIALTRPTDALTITDAGTRAFVYWAHVITPALAVWLYLLHRLAGRRIRWKIGLTWGAVAALFALALLAVQAQDPRQWNVVGNEKGVEYFFPSLARTSTGDFIPAAVLDNDEYCLECHADIHDSWSHSVHKFSSFNNPPYLFSVKNTRRAMMERDGNVQGSRFCAGCHDPVPFFSGAFDDPKFDDPDYDLASDPMAQAGITCTSCHAISHVNSVRGNADYTIDEPIHYPFAFSDQPILKWVNRQLVKSKPEFHKQTFLKPLHQTTEFCGACHKVHLPVELNDYRWLRGQNHYDAFRLSGVSGMGVTSFYYPPQAEVNCNGCHMPMIAVAPEDATRNFSARVRDDSGLLKTLDHQFPSANTAIPMLVGDEMRDPEGAIENHREFLEGVMRVDLFGVRAEGRIDGALTAPIGPAVPALRPGEEVLLETVIRTVKMGHLFTQGTADSNEVWMDVEVLLDGEPIGRSGGMSGEDNEVDPWSFFVNAFVIDRHGNRIDRRNAEDIFVALYNNQIPPGAAAVVHYRLDVPELPDGAEGELTVRAELKYRKFDSLYMRLIHDDPATEELDPFPNELPVTVLAEDVVTFPVGASAESTTEATDASGAFPLWQRWNDYGIGLLRAGQLRQAEHAFLEVERLGYPDGPLNLARVHLAEGRVAEDAPAALQRASVFADASGTGREPYPWSLLWFTGLVNKQNGALDEAIAAFERIRAGGFELAIERGFDFSRDDRLQIELADTLFKRALLMRSPARADDRVAMLRRAEARFLEALTFDPESATAHYGLERVYTELGEMDSAEHHAALHLKYRLDDNARDAAIAAARRRYPAANHAAESVVIYDLHRTDAYGLTSGEPDEGEAPGATEERLSRR